MEIVWYEDQPFMRPIKEQIEKSGLISKLVELSEKYSLEEAQANMKRIKMGHEDFYVCSVFANPEYQEYSVLIQQGMRGGLTGSGGRIRKKCRLPLSEPTKEVLKNSLIPDMVGLIEKYDLIKIEATVMGKKGKVEDAYFCSVLTRPDLKEYIVLIQKGNNADNTFVEKIPKLKQKK